MKWFRRFAKKRWIYAYIVVIVALIAGGFYYTSSNKASAPQYETVAASLSNISQAITISGTIQPVTDLELSFGSTGLVKTVNVQPGQSVKSGQLMAALDTTSLQAQLAQDQALLLSDEAKLASDEGGPSPSVQQSSQAQIANDQNALASANQALIDTQASNQITLTQAQVAVNQAQTSLTEDQAALLLNQQSFANLQKLVIPSSTATSAPVTVQATATSYDLPTSQNTISSNQSFLTADQLALSQAQATLASGCTGSCASAVQNWISQDNAAISALQGAISQANKVIGDLNAVQNSENNLTATQVKIAQSIDSAQQAITSATTALTNAQNAASIASQPASTAQIDSDEASIAAAKASLSNTQQAISQSTITAPVDGVVAQVNISEGKTVAATITTGDIVLESANSFEVSGQVSDTQIAQVQLNQKALVIPAGQTTPLAATVNQITPMATTTQGVASFPVNVLVTQSSSNLFAGASATVEIIVKQVNNVLSVPTSAVHSLGSLNFVNVLQNGQSVRKLVTTGASSGIYTEVTSGLQPGDSVIVANRSSKLPNTSTNFRVNRAAGLGGGIGGGVQTFVGGGNAGRGKG